jgi:hypothetical protein
MPEAALLGLPMLDEAGVELGDDLDELLDHLHTDGGLFANLDGVVPEEEQGAGSAGPPSLLSRCLDASHPPCCTRCASLRAALARSSQRAAGLSPLAPIALPRCSPAPSPEHRSSYVLTGGSLKEVRRLLLLTGEWNSAEERQRLALQLEASASDALLPLIHVLRRRNSRDLSKSHLLQLCFSWNYSCDAWVLRGSNKRKRSAPRNAPGGAAAAPPTFEELSTAQALVRVPRLPSPHVCSLDGDSARLFTSSHLFRLLDDSADAFAGRISRSYTERERVGPYGIPCLAAHRRTQDFFLSTKERWEGAVPGLQAWSAPALAGVGVEEEAREEGEEPSPPAWMLLPLCADHPVDSALREMGEVFRGGHRMLRANIAVVQLGLRAGCTAPPGFKAAQDEYTSALRNGDAFLSAARLLLAQLASSAPLQTYMVGSEAVLRAAIAYAVRCSAAFEERHAWSSAALTVQVASTATEVPPDREWRSYFDYDCLAATAAAAPRPQA